MLLQGPIWGFKFRFTEKGQVMAQVVANGRMNLLPNPTLPLLGERLVLSKVTEMVEVVLLLVCWGKGTREKGHV